MRGRSSPFGHPASRRDEAKNPVTSATLRSVLYRSFFNTLFAARPPQGLYTLEINTLEVGSGASHRALIRSSTSRTIRDLLHLVDRAKLLAFDEIRVSLCDLRRSTLYWKLEPSRKPLLDKHPRPFVRRTLEGFILRGSSRLDMAFVRRGRVQYRKYAIIP